jgi:hypothetical protein
LTNSSVVYVAVLMVSLFPFLRRVSPLCYVRLLRIFASKIGHGATVQLAAERLPRE